MYPYWMFVWAHAVAVEDFVQYLVITELFIEIYYSSFNTDSILCHGFEKLQFSTPLFCHGQMKKPSAFRN